jgi:hypothetical protein
MRKRERTRKRLVDLFAIFLEPGLGSSLELGEWKLMIVGVVSVSIGWPKSKSS